MGGALIAGKGGIGEGDRPARPLNVAADNEGEAAACEPVNDDRRDPGLVDVGGGFMADDGCGVDGTEALGVMGAAARLAYKSVCSEAVVITEPVSEVVEPRRIMLGREPDGKDGVRECRISIRFARETG